MTEGACKVCVIARTQATEQLRVAAGLTSIHDDIVVIIADHVLHHDEITAQHIEALNLMGVRLLTNRKENPFEYVDDARISSVLASCDIVIS